MLVVEEESPADNMQQRDEAVHASQLRELNPLEREPAPP